MSPAIALGITATLVVLAIVLGVILRRRDGRRRDPGMLRFDVADGGALPGTRATLVQFTTELCARCPQVRRQLGDIAARHEGVRHIEIDLTHRPDLAGRYRILQTPTTFVVDPTGAVRARFAGVPDPQALAAALTV